MSKHHLTLSIANTLLDSPILHRLHCFKHKFNFDLNPNNTSKRIPFISDYLTSHFLFVTLQQSWSLIDTFIWHSSDWSLITPTGSFVYLQKIDIRVHIKQIMSESASSVYLASLKAVFIGQLYFKSADNFLHVFQNTSLFQIVKLLIKLFFLCAVIWVFR